MVLKEQQYNMKGNKKMSKDKSSNVCNSIKRKATPEEVARYNSMLSKESSKLNLYRDLGVSNRVTVSGNYSSTASE